MLCDFIMSHGAHAAIPVLLPVGETWGALSVVFTMSLVADLVAHRAVIGQPYQGLCVYIRSWLSVCSLLLSSFPACVQLWAPLPRCEPECQVHSCWPALPASCSCPGTRDPGQEESCRLLVLLVPYTFPDTSCSAQSSYLRLVSDWKLFSLKDSAWGSWSGKGQRKCQKNWLRSLTM